MAGPGEGTSSVRSLAGPSILLLVALALAVLSSVARNDGQNSASGLLAVLALLSAIISSFLLIPKLLSRIRLDFVNSLRFFRFTKRGSAFIVIALVLAFSALNTGNNLLILVLSVILASFIVSGIVANLVLHGLKISMTLPERIHAGQRAVFFVSLENLKRFFPSFALRLKGAQERQDKDESTNFFLQEKSFAYVSAGDSEQVSLHCRFDRRGVYQLNGFEVRTTFPFGFFSRGRALQAEGNIIVYPELLDLTRLVRSNPFLMGVQEQSHRGSGSGLYNIRPYAAGEGTRFVHWKSTAKLSRLMVKDFVAEEARPPTLVFSTYLSNPDEAALEQFEKAVSYLATLGDEHGRSGQTFRFYSGEFDVRISGLGPDFESFMEYLATAEPSPKPLVDTRDWGGRAIIFQAGPGGLDSSMTINFLEL